MSNVVAELERRLEQAEDENDALELRLAKIEDALFGGERIPAAIVDRLAVRRRFESQTYRSGFSARPWPHIGASEARRDHHRRSRPGATPGRASKSRRFRHRDRSAPQRAPTGLLPDQPGGLRFRRARAKRRSPTGLRAMPS